MTPEPRVAVLYPRIPASVPVLRDLVARGVRVQVGAEESSEGFEARMETSLMALFRDQRGEAQFHALYDYTRGALLTWIVSLCAERRNGPDPLEILQDTFINAYRYAASFRDDEPRSFRVWSRTIAGNLIRRQGAARARAAFGALPDGLEEPADPRHGPAEALVAVEETRITAAAWMLVLLRYAAAFERLAPRDRLALELIEVQGLSYAEAGARLRVGMSNMKMIMFRSRRRIRASIERELDARFASGRETAARLAG